MLQLSLQLQLWVTSEVIWLLWMARWPWIDQHDVDEGLCHLQRLSRFTIYINDYILLLISHRMIIWNWLSRSLTKHPNLDFLDQLKCQQWSNYKSVHDQDYSSTFAQIQSRGEILVWYGYQVTKLKNHCRKLPVHSLTLANIVSQHPLGLVQDFHFVWCLGGKVVDHWLCVSWNWCLSMGSNPVWVAITKSVCSATIIITITIMGD